MNNEKVFESLLQELENKREFYSGQLEGICDAIDLLRLVYKPIMKEADYLKKMSEEPLDTRSVEEFEEMVKWELKRMKRDAEKQQDSIRYGAGPCYQKEVK